MSPSTEGRRGPKCLAGGPLVVVLSGPSGVGKDLLLSYMRDRSTGWHFVVTATTRPQRTGERDGVDYIFLEQARFHRMIDRNEFLEYAKVYHYSYGVPRQQVSTALERGLNVLVKTDVQGAATLKKKMPDAVFIFLAPPSMHELENRLRERKTESPEQLALRIETARLEMEQHTNFDYVIVNHNDQIMDAVVRLEAITATEKCRIPPRQIFL
jgi:guanylate kinase